MKRYLIYAILLFTLGTNLYSKEVNILFRHPFTDATSNTYNSYSVQQLFGAGNEFLFRQIGSNEYWGIRLLEFSIMTYASAFWSSFSHEWAHYRTARFYGLNPSIKINFFGGEVRHRATASIDQNIIIVAAGLNQQELNAEYAYEKIILKGKMSYIDGLYLIMNRFGTLAYSIVTVGGYNSPGNDIINYEDFTALKGIEVDRYEQLQYSAISAAASFVVWQNFFLAYDFVVNNNRSIPVKTFLNGYITPPLFQYYLTENGDLFNAVIPVLKPVPVFLWIGFGLESFFIPGWG